MSYWQKFVAGPRERETEASVKRFWKYNSYLRITRDFKTYYAKDEHPCSILPEKKNSNHRLDLTTQPWQRLFTYSYPTNGALDTILAEIK